MLVEDVPAFPHVFDAWVVAPTVAASDIHIGSFAHPRYTVIGIPSAVVVIGSVWSIHQCMSPCM